MNHVKCNRFGNKRQGCRRTAGTGIMEEGVIEKEYSMKKPFALLCAAVLFLSFAACGKKPAGKAKTVEETTSIGGYDAVRIDDNVFYVEAVNLESDAGENPGAFDSAKTAWAALKKMNLKAKHGGNIYISLRGVKYIDGEDRYAYTVGMGDEYETGDKYIDVYSIWVNYAGDVFTVRDGETLIFSEKSGGWEPAGEERGNLTRKLNKNKAMLIAAEHLSVQMDEGRTLVAEGEGDVNGQHAFLFALGNDTEEKFTAEEHYAVTDDGKVWLLDVIEDEWQPAGVG